MLREWVDIDENENENENGKEKLNSTSVENYKKQHKDCLQTASQ